MTPKPKTPDVLPVETAGTHGDKQYSHPAFGQIVAHRVASSRGVNLLGSDFPHAHFVEISISEAELIRSGIRHDTTYGKKELIQVSLSEAQWASFVSSMNGSGSPCTLERVAGERIPAIPARDKAKVVTSEIEAKVATLVTDIDKAIENVRGELGTALSEKKRSALLAPLLHLRNTVSAGLPWVSKMFKEETENTISRAKIEVNAYVTNHIHQAGLQALGAAGKGPLLLNQGDQGDSEP